MDLAAFAQIFNIVAPFVFQGIKAFQTANPEASYKEALEASGIKLDVEYAKLLEDMAKAVAEGAVPRVPPQ